MGIINLTPDSFYKESRYQEADACIARAETMISEGAAIIDLGAVSTRPGIELADAGEEMKRLMPVLEALVKRFPETVFSIDTFRGAVAKAGFEAGAGMINDISAGKLDPTLLPEVAQSGLPYVLMHMQGTPDNMQQSPHYEDVVIDIREFFTEKIQLLNNNGIQNIILDPGFGFGKTIGHNYTLINHLSEFKPLNRPLLVGISRKSMIYKLLHISPDESLNATTALNMAALLRGASILRVHDVKEAAEVVKVFNAMNAD